MAIPCGRLNWPGPLPGLAPRLEEPPVGREAVDPGVAVAVGRVELAVRGQRHVRHRVERLRAARDRRPPGDIARVRRPAVADPPPLCALGRVLVDRVALVVHEEHAVVGADEDPVGAHEGAGAPRVDEPAFLVEDDQGMRAAAEDEHALAGIDRDADHLGEGPAVREALPALHDLVLQPVTADRHDGSSFVRVTVHLTRGRSPGNRGARSRLSRRAPAAGPVAGSRVRPGVFSWRPPEARGSSRAVLRTERSTKEGICRRVRTRRLAVRCSEWGWGSPRARWPAVPGRRRRTSTGCSRRGSRSS